MYPSEAITYLLAVIRGQIPRNDWGRILNAIGDINKWVATLFHPAPMTAVSGAAESFASVDVAVHNLPPAELAEVEEVRRELAINPAIFGLIGQALLLVLEKLLGRLKPPVA